MARSIGDLLDAVADAASRQRSRELLRLFDLPLADALGGDGSLVSASDRALQVVEAYLTELDALGVRAIRAARHEVVETRGDARVIRVRWDYLRSDGDVAFYTVNRMVVGAEAGGTLRIVAVEAMHDINPVLHRVMRANGLAVPEARDGNG